MNLSSSLKKLNRKGYLIIDKIFTKKKNKKDKDKIRKNFKKNT